MIVDGRSGISHEFSEAKLIDLSDESDDRTNTIMEKVADIYERGATEIDVLALYAKAFDVAAKKTELRAPSFTGSARKLAGLYNIRLIKTERLSPRGFRTERAEPHR